MFSKVLSYSLTLLVVFCFLVSFSQASGTRAGQTSVEEHVEKINKVVGKSRILSIEEYRGSTAEEEGEYDEEEEEN